MKEIDEFLLFCHQCTFCLIFFETEELLAAHHATCSSRKKRMETNIKTCNFCYWTFETQELFNAHIITCASKPYRCQYCAEAVSTPSMVSHHRCQNKIALEDRLDKNNEKNRKDYCPIDITDEILKTNNKIDKESTHSCPIEIIKDKSSENKKDETDEKVKQDETKEKVEKDKTDEKKTRKYKKKKNKKFKGFSVWWKNKKNKKRKK